MNYRASWKYKNLPEDRIDHLKKCPPYKEIIHQFAINISKAEIGFEIDRGYIQPVTDSLRPLFYVKNIEDNGLFDWFFNGQSGYRAQYYLRPENGLNANRDIFIALEKSLLDCANKAQFRFQHCDYGELEMDEGEIWRSLRMPSAKIWGDEHEGELMKIAGELQDKNPQIVADRWLEQARNGEQKACKGIKAPQITTLKFHGAFVKGGEERIPPDKVDRSKHIHLFGWS